MNDNISPSTPGYRPGAPGGVDLANGGFGRADNDINNRASEPREEEAVACARCGQLPNDVLILTCDHNLCLRCASHNLRAQNEKSGQGKAGDSG